MKNYILLGLFLPLFVFLELFASSVKLSLGNETKEYDKIFNEISETRVGVSSEKINKLKNPFLIVYKKISDKNTTKSEKIIYFSLDAIFNNKAKINGKWIKLYSKVNGYKLVKIKRNSVVLRNSTNKKEIFIRKKDDKNIKFSIN